MSKTKKALQIFVVLAFLIGLCALTIAEVVPNPDDIARKLQETKAAATEPAEFDLRANPHQGQGLSDYSFRFQYLSEGFEGGVIPPTGWTLTQFNPVETWGISTYNPFEGSYNAHCLYDATYTDVQDEWLISPAMDLTSATTDLKLSFAWLGSYYWSVDPNNNCDLNVLVSTDGSSWTELWDEHSAGVFTNWTWYEQDIDLSAYVGEATFYVAFQYEGYDGAEFGIDAIDVNDDPLPTGRCCYGDPSAPDCDDVTELACDGLGGDWSAGITCTGNPCPVAGPNDDCDYAIEIFNGDDVEGTTTGATIDCPGVLDWNSVWYKFDAPYSANDVVFDYCNTPSPVNLECLGVVVYDECPADCSNYILYSEISWVSCGSLPSTQPIVYHNRMPGPATYWYPVFIGDGSCNNIESPFAFHFGLTESDPVPEGGECGNPFSITLPADLDYQDFNSTYGKVNVYENTCLGSYDGGEDAVYEITVTAPTAVDVLLTPFDTYSGFLIDDECPPDPTTCLYEATAGFSSNQYGFYNITLPAGTYYLIIDTWPAPDYVDYILDITAPAPTTPGNDCSDPIVVKLPADLPYEDIAQKTCTRINDYSATCLGYYDGGEDIIYQLDVTDATAVIITLDPKGTTWTGIAIDDACPLSSACLAYKTGSSGTTLKVIEIALDAGTYYVMVDTWPSPACIADFDLYIDQGPSLAYSPADFDFGTVNVGDAGSDQLNISNVGGGTLEYDCVTAYNLNKEIDGAYVEALDQYKPGLTMDIDLFLQNASSDAEWLDEVTVTFPAGVTINSGTNFNSTSSTRYLAYDGTTGDGVTVTWYDHNGGYGNIYSTEAALATMNISFDAGLVGNLTCGFTISGDDWGGAPHDISGSFTIGEVDPLTGWLFVSPTSGTVPGGGTDPVTVSYDATDLFNDTYNADIIMSHNGGKAEAIVPVTMVVTGGDSKAVIAPEPSYIYYKYAADPIMASLFVGHFNAPYTAADVVGATVGGEAATVVGVTTHPDFTGDVVELEFPLSALLETFGAPIGLNEFRVDVDCEYGDATAFVGKCRFDCYGKTADGKRWIAPPDQIIVPGDGNLSGYVDVDDVVQLIAIIFQGGEIFGPFLTNDVNCSHSVDIDDVVYMIGYIFASGPAPCNVDAGE